MSAPARAALLLLPLLALASPAAAQGRCPAGASVAEAPAGLAGSSLLFRQDGVLFHARVEGDSAPGAARLVIQNRNPYPVEVGYDVTVVGADGERTGFPERCARVGAGEYAPDAGDNAVFTPGAGKVAAVRLSNLRITRLGAAPAEPSPAPPSTASAGPAGWRRSPEPAQYRCSEGPDDVAARAACNAAFMGAAARAAAEAGAFSGTTRECLLQYAEAQEGAARLIRSGTAAGGVLRTMVPSCYSRASAQWGYESLAAACPHGRWTAANRGVVGCAAPAAVAAATAPAGAPPAAGPAPLPAPTAEGADEARRASEAARALLVRGDAAGAEAELRRAVSIAPAEGAYHAQLGDALARQGRWPEAAAEYRAAVWLEPGNADFREMLRRAGEAGEEKAAAEGVAAESAAPEEMARVEEVPEGVQWVQTALRLVLGTMLSAAALLLVVTPAWSLWQLVLRAGAQLLGRTGPQPAR